MNKLDVNNQLFKKLASDPPKWWNNLVNDKDVIIQIRKNNYIDVYFNGGVIVRNLTFDGKSFKGETHCKYIPLTGAKQNYVPFVFKNDSIECGEVKPIQLKCFDKDSLDKIKSNIENFYPSDSEKAIQYKFIKNDPFFIDSEFEYAHNDGKENKTIRIDLVRADAVTERIVFVEVKTIGDRRLFNNKIVEQVESYKNFIKKYKEALLAYYKKIIKIKNNLKILPECIKLEAVENYQVLEKPLLLFGDCEQSWIDKNASDLDKKIKDCAVGCYYFGKPEYRCDILSKQKHNRHIF